MAPRGFDHSLDSAPRTAGEVSFDLTQVSERTSPPTPARLHYRQNSASKMMIGIGTPSSQSNIEPPIESSWIVCLNSAPVACRASSGGGEACAEGAQKQRGDQPEGKLHGDP